MLACEHAANLTEQLLSFSRGENQRQPLKRISLASVLRQVERLLTPTIPPHVAIHLEMAETPAYILADEAQLQQLTVNLSTNAIQAIGDQPGTITMSFTTKDLTGEKSNSRLQRMTGPHVEFRVHDSGDGVTEETKRRMFDPYYTTRDNGTGLGLSVVHGIVEQLGGAIEVVSGDCAGTCFVITLPSAAARSSPAPKNGFTAHILLADDAPALREALKQLLQSFQYQVTVATNGREALDVFRASPASFDIIVTDHHMPTTTCRS